MDELLSLSVDLGRASASAERKAQQAVEKTAFDIVADAQTLVHVITGNLKNSIGADIGTLEAEVGPTAVYGAVEEFGSAYRGPHPYMRPAFDRRAPGLEQALQQIADGTVT